MNVLFPRSALLLLVVVVIAGCSRGPRWQTTHSGRETISAGEAFGEELKPSEDRQLRVILSEENDLPLVAYWLPLDKHQQAHAGISSEELSQAIERNTFLRGAGGDVIGEATIPQGRIYAYFRQDVSVSEPQELNLKYTIQVFR